MKWGSLVKTTFFGHMFYLAAALFTACALAQSTSTSISISASPSPTPYPAVNMCASSTGSSLSLTSGRAFADIFTNDGAGSGSGSYVDNLNCQLTLNNAVGGSLRLDFLCVSQLFARPLARGPTRLSPQHFPHPLSQRLQHGGVI